MGQNFLLILWPNNILCVYIPHFHLTIDGHSDCFHILAMVNNATMNTGVKISPEDPFFNSFGYTAKSGIAGSNSDCILKFLSNFLVFRSDCTILQSHQKHIMVQFLHTSPYFLFFDSSQRPSLLFIWLLFGWSIFSILLLVTNVYFTPKVDLLELV